MIATQNNKNHQQPTSIQFNHQIKTNSGLFCVLFVACVALDTTSMVTHHKTKTGKNNSQPIHSRLIVGSENYSALHSRLVDNIIAV